MTEKLPPKSSSSDTDLLRVRDRPDMAPMSKTLSTSHDYVLPPDTAGPNTPLSHSEPSNKRVSEKDRHAPKPRQCEPLRNSSESGQEQELQDESKTEISRGDSQTKRVEGPKKSSKTVNARTGGRDIAKSVLYVGSLDPTISEQDLHTFLSSNGSVLSVKLLNDKNKPGLNYAFVQFRSDEAAQEASQQYQGHVLKGSQLQINFAYQSSTFNTHKRSDVHTFNVFVGDLASEVDDERLFQFFSHLESLRSAHVMWDMQTGRSRGYGFITFTAVADAETALSNMNGASLLGRNIRCNWAQYRSSGVGARPKSRSSSKPKYPLFGGQFQYNFSAVDSPTSAVTESCDGSGHYYSAEESQGQQQDPAKIDGRDASFAEEANSKNAESLDHKAPKQNLASIGGIPGTSHLQYSAFNHEDYESVILQAPFWQTTVYVGNVAHVASQQHLLPLLQNFGFIVDLKFYPEKGCAFVKYGTHECAAQAIVQMTGLAVDGRPLRCGWGKSRWESQKFPSKSKSSQFQKQSGSYQGYMGYQNFQAAGYQKTALSYQEMPNPGYQDHTSYQRIQDNAGSQNPRY